MPDFNLAQPCIPSHFYVYSEPPDDAGDETLHFFSSTRRVKLRGHTFREFVRHVVPLLDGKHSFEQIHSEVTDLFAAQDLLACLELLSAQGLLVDAATNPLPEEIRDAMQPQTNLFHEISLSVSASPEGYYQENLSQSCVAILGLSGAGANAAISLAATGVGRLRLLDNGVVEAADTYLSSAFDSADAGQFRAVILQNKLRTLAPLSEVSAVTDSLNTDENVTAALAGADFVVNCLDEGNISLVYKLNRICLSQGIPWTSATPVGMEIILGPTVIPGETACYMCYRMRLVACADSPESEFNYQSYLDRNKHDDSTRRANLVSGVAMAGQLAALEAAKFLGRFSPNACRGRVTIFDLQELTSSKHVVLRKPWCPACMQNWETES